MSEEKLSGRYFTPQQIADFITKWVMTQKKPVTSILEPSVGNGVFIRSVLNSSLMSKAARFLSLEVDEDVSKEAALCGNNITWVKGWNRDRENLITVVNEDFYEAYKNGLSQQRFDAVLGNPPYIRYQYLDESQRSEQSDILIKNGMKSNKLINAWVSFTVACVSCMSQDSKIGFVIPAELLQVKYSEGLRKFLSRHLNKITIITFQNLVFEGIEQEVLLLLGEKISGSMDHDIRIIQFEDLTELEDFDIDDYEFFAADVKSSKWTKYFLNDAELEQVQLAEQDARFVRFSEIAKCEVGITTGNNEYFCVDDAKVQKYQLQSFCKPLIARSVNIQGAEFTYEDWKKNIDDGARTYLLDLAPFDISEFNIGVKQYIEVGEKEGYNSTYKCQIRDEWYKVPSVWAPEAFFLRRNYLYPKFMLNTDAVKAVSTDTMHRVRFRKNEYKMRAVVGYYTSVGLLFSELEGRSYGGGVLEILPGEIGKVLLPNIFRKDIISDEEVVNIFKIIDRHIRNNTDIIDLLKMMDEKILVDKLNFTERQVELFRSAWINLRNRRLVRGGREATNLN